MNFWRMNKKGWWVGLCLVGLTGGFWPWAVQAADKAEMQYQTYCWQCHGMNGDGKGLNIKDMQVQPRNHTDAKAMGGRSDDELFKVIKEGGPAISKSVIMPPWGKTLSDNEIRELVRYLRQLCKCG